MIAVLCWPVLCIAGIVIERVAASPRAPGPSIGALPLRFALYGALYLFWLGLWGRPLLGLAAALITLAVLAAVSWRKRQLVGEPLTFADFGLLRMIVRHPDLYYMSFMAEPPFLAAAAVFVAALAAWLWWEPAYTVLSWHASLAAVAAIVGAEAAAWRLAPTVSGALRRLVPEPELERHVGRWGLLLTLVAYGLRWRASIEEPATGVDEPMPKLAGAVPVDPVHVVVVQFESFLDPVRYGLSKTALPGLARARSLALWHGPLRVPSHGAFTMRSEHAVLTGLSEQELGFRRFDPYFSARGPVPLTIASLLKGRGFRTVFMHPFRPGFFGRDRVVARFGFDELLFEDDFAAAARLGPYVSDVALAERVLAEVDRAERVFVAAVTMENHGPWAAGRLAEEPDPTRQYLLHLRGTDMAIGVLIDGLTARGRPTLLCIYGDHPPILPRTQPAAEPETDYAVLLLNAGETMPDLARSLTAAELGRLISRLCGAS